MLVIGVCGLPGSGKTTACLHLARKYGAIHIEVDSIVQDVLRTEADTLNSAICQVSHSTPYPKPSDIADSFFKSHLPDRTADYFFKRSIEKQVLVMLNNENDKSTILIDWAFLPLSPLIQFCESIIYVEADTDTIHQRAEDRGDRSATEKRALISTRLNRERAKTRVHYIARTHIPGWIELLDRFYSFNYSGSQMISVIIPVFNDERCIARCIDSVINQSYRNLEIIIVDDGSTDASNKIASMYAMNDVRIKIVRQSNAGLSQARNTGLDHASGDYIAFVDSDDYLEPRAYEALLRYAIETGTDAVSCRAFIHDRYNGTISGQAKDGATKKLNKGVLENLTAYVAGEMTFAVWDKLFTSDSLRNLRFSSEVFNEDADFMLQFVLNRNDVLCIPDQLYHHVKASGSSLTGSVFDERLLLTRDWANAQYLHLLSLGSAYNNCATKLRFNALSHVIKCYMRDFSRGCPLKHFKREISEIARETQRIVLSFENPDQLIDLDNVLNIIDELEKAQIVEGSREVKRVRCIGILWNSLDADLQEHALKMIGARSHKLTHCVQTLDASLYANFIDDIYYFNDQNEDKEGTAYFKKCTVIDKYESNTITIMNVEIEVTGLIFDRRKGSYFYREIIALKKVIRDYFKSRIKNYAFDNVFHLTVNEDEYEYSLQVCREYFGDEFCAKY